jgi:hypothetical protein
MNNLQRALLSVNTEHFGVGTDGEAADMDWFADTSGEYADTDMVVSKLNAVMESIRGRGDISVRDVATLESILPGVITKHIPEFEFTVQGSEQNLEVALEAAGLGSTILIGVLGFVIINVIVVLLHRIATIFTNSSSDGKSTSTVIAAKKFDATLAKVTAENAVMKVEFVAKPFEKCVNSLAKWLREFTWQRAQHGYSGVITGENPTHSKEIMDSADALAKAYQRVFTKYLAISGDQAVTESTLVDSYYSNVLSRYLKKGPGLFAGEYIQSVNSKLFTSETHVHLDKILKYVEAVEQAVPRQLAEFDKTSAVYAKMLDELTRVDVNHADVARQYINHGTPMAEEVAGAYHKPVNYMAMAGEVLTGKQSDATYNDGQSRAGSLWLQDVLGTMGNPPLYGAAALPVVILIATPHVAERMDTTLVAIQKLTSEFKSHISKLEGEMNNLRAREHDWAAKMGSDAMRTTPLRNVDASLSQAQEYLLDSLKVFRGTLSTLGGIAHHYVKPKELLDQMDKDLNIFKNEYDNVQRVDLDQFAKMYRLDGYKLAKAEHAKGVVTGIQD